MEVGDRVLVKVVAFEGKHKIADRWEDIPYIIYEQPNADIPVYKVKREDGEGRCKTLHRNLLLPIGTKLPSPIPTPAPRRSTTRKQETIIESVPSSEDEDTEDELFLIGTGTKTHKDQEKEDAPTTISDIPDDDVQGPESETENSSTGTVLDESDHNDSVTEDHQSEAADSDPDEPTSPNTPPAQLRASNRRRMKPKWTEDFVMSHQISSTPEWMQKATYLQNLIASGTFQSLDKEASTALLSIITGK